jgi:hypothetical protein
MRFFAGVSRGVAFFRVLCSGQIGGGGFFYHSDGW